MQFGSVKLAQLWGLDKVLRVWQFFFNYTAFLKYEEQNKWLEEGYGMAEELTSHSYTMDLV